MAADAFERPERSVPGSVTVTFAAPDSVRVALHGEWDISTEPRLAEAFDLASRRRRDNVVVDLSDCRFLDSRTIARLMTFARELAEAGGRLAVAAPPSQGVVNRAFSLLGVRDLLSVHDTLEDAQQSVAPRAGPTPRAWLEPSPPMPID